MVSFFNVLGLLLWVLSIGSCAMAKGAIQETGGLVMFLTGTVLIVGAALLGQLHKMDKAKNEN